MKVNKGLVSYHNDMNRAGIESITSQEVDLFIGICQKLRDKGDGEVTFSYEDLRNLAGRRRNQKGEFTVFLDSFSSKMGGINCRIVTYKKKGRVIEKFPLFSYFKIDEHDLSLKIKLNSDYLYMFNNLETQFTSFSLQELNQLSNKYSKLLFKQLMQYKSTGFYRVSMEDFLVIMSIPESYTTKKITANVLNKAISEINEISPITDLRVKKCANGKGKTITHLEFSFRIEDRSQVLDKKNTSIDYPGLDDEMIEELIKLYN